MAQGVLALLEDLPVCHVKVNDLPSLVSNPGEWISCVAPLLCTHSSRAETDLHKVHSF